MARTLARGLPVVNLNQVLRAFVRAVLRGDANCHGLNVCSYGWAPLAVPYRKSALTALADESVTQAYKLAELYEGPLWSTLVRSEDHIERSIARLDNESVRIETFYFDAQLQEYVLRLLNVTKEPQRARLFVDQAHFQGARVCALNGDQLGPLELTSDGMTIEFGKNELKTIALMGNRRPSF